MLEYRNILVIIEPDAETQPALLRAVELARLESLTRLKVFMAIYDFSYEITSILSSEERDEMRDGVLSHRREQLQQIIQPYLNEGIDIEIRVVWNSRPFEQVLQEVKEANHDLVIKSAHEHSLLQTFIFTPTDWHLIRKCSCPVLLVKEHAWPEGGVVMAALNFNDEPAQLALNHKIIRAAQQLSLLLKAKLHLVNAFPAPTVNIALEVPGFTPEMYLDAIRQHHVQQMADLAREYTVPSEQTHITEGLPEDTLPELAERLDAELMVVGSVGRTGWSAALIGNTAEQVVDSLHCDLLVVKPDTTDTNS